MLRTVAFDLLEQTQMQVSPFAHRLALIVALLPAVQTVAGGALFLIPPRLPLLEGPLRAQLKLERIEHIGNVIVELSAGDGGSSGQLRVTVDRCSPAQQNRFAAR